MLTIGVTNEVISKVEISAAIEVITRSTTVATQPRRMSASFAGWGPSAASLHTSPADVEFQNAKCGTSL